MDQNQQQFDRAAFRNSNLRASEILLRSSSVFAQVARHGQEPRESEPGRATTRAGKMNRTNINEAIAGQMNMVDGQISRLAPEDLEQSGITEVDDIRTKDFNI